MKFPWRFEDLPKSHQLLESLVMFGNVNFSRKLFDSSLDMHQAVLCYAPPGSEQIPLAYSTRSRVYCEIGNYDLAIENSIMAKITGLPADRIQQQDAREEYCRRMMQEFGPTKCLGIASFFKLSHPPNPTIPFIANCLELRRNEKYGRFIVTNKDLKTGDIIAVENAAIVWRNPLYEIAACGFCARTNYGSLYPCQHCTSVVYCSSECKKKDIVHLNDAYGKSPDKLLWTTIKLLIESFRIAGGVDELLQLLERSGDQERTIFDFDWSIPDDSSYEQKMLIALNGLCKDYNETVEVNPEVLLNIPPIKERQRSPDEKHQLLSYIIKLYMIISTNTLKDSSDRLQGIYLFQSLLNHSCLPNVDCIPFEDQLVVVATRPIKAGEQIFCYYGASDMCYSTSQRQAMLQKLPFICDCEACVNNYRLPFPRKDINFRQPTNAPMTPTAIIIQFKKNCKYIDANSGWMPCYEVQNLMFHNSYLLRMLTEITVSKLLSP